MVSKVLIRQDNELTLGLHVWVLISKELFH